MEPTFNQVEGSLSEKPNKESDKSPIQETTEENEDVDANQFVSKQNPTEKDEMPSQPNVIVPLMEKTYKGEDFCMEVEDGLGRHEKTFESPFTEKSIRNTFVCKVYGIMSLQLTITAAIVSVFTLIEDVWEWTHENSWTFYLTIALVVVLMFVLVYYHSFSRTAPGNFICLGIFTIGLGILLGTSVSVFHADAILMAVGICILVTVTLSIFSFQTKFEVTRSRSVICVILIIFIIAGVSLSFLPKNKFEMILYSVFGSLMFCIYVVCDIHMIMGGKANTITPKDYVYAALKLYLDIINLCFYALNLIFSALKRSKSI